MSSNGYWELWRRDPGSSSLRSISGPATPTVRTLSGTRSYRLGCGLPRVRRPQLIVIRHGETEWSRSGRHTGRTDVPLTERCRSGPTAATLAGWDLSRPTRAPEARPPNRPPRRARMRLVVDDDLVEWDYGDYEGETTPRHGSGSRAGRSGRTRSSTARRSTRWGTGRIGSSPGSIATARRQRRGVRPWAPARDPDRPWCGLPAVEGRRFALATATVSLLGWHREDRVIRALNHRVGDVFDPPFRT